MTQGPTPADERKPTIAELEARVREAGAKGDLDTLVALAKQVDALRADERKAAVEKVASARAGRCKGIADAILPTLEKVATEAALEGLGERVNISYTPSSHLLSVAIASAAPAAATRTSTSGGAGKPGAMKDLTGKSLDQNFREVASADDIAKHDSLANNSAKYSLKNRIVQAAIADGRIKTV